MSLIRFYSPAGAEVLMLSAHLMPVIRETGLRFEPSSAILPEDLPQAIKAVEEAVRKLSEVREDEPEAREEDGAKKVALSVRFYPLLELMRSAERKGKLLHWETL